MTIKRTKELMSKAVFLRIWNSPTFTTMGSFFSKSISLLLVTSLILKGFSVEEVAVWFLFSTIISLGFILDLGFAPTFIRLVSYILGNNSKQREHEEDLRKDSSKWHEMQRLYGTIGFIYLLLTSALIVFFTAIGFFFFKKHAQACPNAQEVWIAWFLICFGASVNFYGTKYDSIMKGMNFIPLMNRWNILFTICSSISQVTVLLLGGHLLHLVIVNQAFSLLNVVRNRYLLRSVYDGRFKSFKSFSFDKEVFSRAWPPSWKTGILVFVSQSGVHISGLIYAQYADVKLLAAYLFSLRVIMLVNEFSWAPFYSKLPVYSRLRSEGKLGELSVLAFTGIQNSLLLFTVGSFAAGISMDFILNQLHSTTQFVSGNLWALMMVTFFLERHHAMHAQIYLTTNKVPFYITSSISTGLYWFGLYFLIQRIGIWAPISCQFASNLVINNWYNVRISMRSLERSITSYFWQYLKYPALLLVIFVAILYVTK